MKKLLLSGALVFGLISGSIAQISEGGLPTTFVKLKVDEQNPYDVPYEIVDVQRPDVEAAVLEDEKEDLKGAYRIGLNTPVNINMLNSGSWMELGNGDRIWRLGVRSAGAKAINLYFGAPVTIPEGGKLHAYNENQSQYVGAFTANTPSFQAMEMIQGEVVTLEYYMPAGSMEYPSIHISEIGHLYRGVEGRVAVFEDGYTQNQYKADPCQVDVACSEINGWEEQRDAVVHYSFVAGGTYVCSGSVINNTSNDCTPYILSANHCGDPDANNDITNHVWYFNYQRPTCSPGVTSQYTGALSETMSGGTFRASSSLGNYPAGTGSQVDGSDFVLVELNSAIPQSYGAYYAGWNRNASASSSGVGIHHPAGHEKKISTYSSSLSSSTYNGGWANAHWYVTWVATANGHGVTEGGSSGSPIFNPSGEIVGHLSGGSSYCTSPNSPDLYGKFRNAWDMEGTNANQQLAAWLDPGNTGATTMTGTYSPCGPTAPTADFVADQTVVLPATTVSFTDQSSGIPTSWAWSVTPATGWAYTGGTNASSQNPQITFNTLGFYTVALTATNGQGNDTETKIDYIEVTNTVGPCAASGTSDCSAGNASEYISNVTLETINNSTDCSDYSDYTAQSATLTKSSSYDVTVQPGVAGTGPGQAYTDDEIAVWIDWNDDADFDDAGEQVGYVIVATGFSSTFNFTVPATAVTGDVVMRCRISYQPDDGPITPCGTTTWGEVEDYTITIVDAGGGSAPTADFTASATNVTEGTTVSFTDLSSNSPTSWSWSVTPASGWTYTGGTNASSQNPQIQFNTAGTYTVALTASNGSGSDTETKTNYITVTSSGGASIDENDLSKVVIYPNPTNGTVNVNFTNVTADIKSVELRDITGRIIAVDAVKNGSSSFDLTHEASGVYFIKINAESASLTKKVVKF